VTGSLVTKMMTWNEAHPYGSL